MAKAGKHSDLMPKTCFQNAVVSSQMGPQRWWSQAAKCVQSFQWDKNSHCISAVCFCNAVNTPYISRWRSHSAADSESLATSEGKQQSGTGIWWQVYQETSHFLTCGWSRCTWVSGIFWAEANLALFLGNCKRQIKSVSGLNLTPGCEIPVHMAVLSSWLLWEQCICGDCCWSHLDVSW